MTTLPRALALTRRRSTCFLVAASCVASLLTQDSARAASPADVAILKKTLSAIETKGKAAFDGRVAAGLEAQWKLLSDPALQARARELTPELEKAAAWRLRVLDVIAKTNEAKGT